MSTLVLILLIVTGLSGILAIAERLISLRQNSVVSTDLIDKAKMLVRMGDLEGASNLGQESETIFGEILQAGISSYQLDNDDLRDALLDAAGNRFRLIRRKKTVLLLVAIIAPLVGILGSVVKTIEILGRAAADGTSTTEVFAEIAGSLTTTAAGLAISIPCVAAILLFRAMTEKYLATCHTALVQVARIWRSTRKRSSMDMRVEETTDLSSGRDPAAEKTNEETQDVGTA